MPYALEWIEGLSCLLELGYVTVRRELAQMGSGRCGTVYWCRVEYEYVAQERSANALAREQSLMSAGMAELGQEVDCVAESWVELGWIERVAEREVELTAEPGMTESDWADFAAESGWAEPGVELVADEVDCVISYGVSYGVGRAANHAASQEARAGFASFQRLAA